MDWTQAIDGYCERTDPGYWSEPVNAVTNLAFIIAAIIMWKRTAGLPAGRWLSGVLGAIGVGSYLFHTHAMVWSATLDVLPIAVFTLSFIYLANRDFWGLPVWGAALGTIAFFPYAAVLTPVFSSLPFFSISSVYWVLPVLIAAYGLLLRKRASETGHGLLIGAGILTLSLVFRSLDEVLCAHIPAGTHFMWHILNGVVLGWMIEVWRRHKTSVA
ncbi:MAG: hypothetical protein HKP54_05870 [Boseongicola sp.]|nr:hypothetical protein [Boseongicola sp.]